MRAILSQQLIGSSTLVFVTNNSSSPNFEENIKCFIKKQKQTKNTYVDSNDAFTSMEH